MKATKHTHYILLILTLLGTIVCGILIPRINVNADMTRYLPSDSQMKQGMEILEKDFHQTNLTSTGIKVMTDGLSEREADSLRLTLNRLPDVSLVSLRFNEDSTKTLFSLTVPATIDQKHLGKEIKEQVGRHAVVETSQDTATPPMSVVVIAAVLVLLIVLVMSQSWAEPLIILSTLGIAVLINMGTNALLPSVSITTNYIGSIIQLVLSLDYAIILMNRYRQENKPGRETIEAVNKAVKRAAKPVLSSSLTTLVGLLMLCFMRLRIGMDLGLVLAKGVLCCLICTFTILPSFILLMHGWIEKSGKKTISIPTDGLSNFVTSHKISMSMFALALFAGAFYFSRQTDICFSLDNPSEIGEVFPEPNPFVVVYSTEDEEAVIGLSDSLEQQAGVTRVLSNPTLLRRKLTADEMADYTIRMAEQFADYTDEAPDLSMLTPEMIEMVYYMHKGEAESIRLTFPELMRYITEDCMKDEMFAQYISEDMRKQAAMLKTMMPEQQTTAHRTKKKATKVATPAVTEPAAEAAPDTTSAAEQTTEEVKPAEVKKEDKVEISRFMEQLAEAVPNDDSRYLMSITDRTKINTKMNVEEISAFIGSSPSQTKMVFKFTDGGSERTPLEYVHSLVDDLFQRKLIGAMASNQDKASLRRIATIMDYADEKAKLSFEKMANLLTDYGFNGIDAGVVEQIAYPQTIASNEEKSEEASAETVAPAPVITVSAQAARPKAHKKTRAERQAELFMQLMESKRGYSAQQMAANFKKLGQPIDENTARLLYLSYGFRHAEADSSRMTPEQLLCYVSDTLVKDSAMTPFINAEAREAIAEVNTTLATAIEQLTTEQHGLMLVLTDLPKESAETYAFTDELNRQAAEQLQGEWYTIGESVMFDEMKKGFNSELLWLTIFTVLSIFLIVAVSFRSLLVPTILVMTVMTAVYVNVIVSGLASGHMLYLAYLIVQSILMGATIDYGILFSNYYREKRHKGMAEREAAMEAYRGSIRTILTSGSVMFVAPGVMALLVKDPMISSIVGCLAVGSLVAIILILCVLPAVLVAWDRLLVRMPWHKGEEEE